MTDTPLPCPTCAKITLWQKLFQRAHDSERLADNREAAQQHVISHNVGLAHGTVTPDVKSIANSNNGEK